MTAAASALPFACAPDLNAALEDWRRWLAQEKRSSHHTCRAYHADVAAFLTFLSGHFGQSVALNDLSLIHI